MYKPHFKALNMWTFALLLLTHAVVGVAEPCLNYSNEQTKLSGRVLIKTFYGPPNYGESPETDAKVKQTILRLNNPICTIETDEDYAEQNQVEITLVPMHAINLMPFTGKRVTVTGKLEHASTANQHTPLHMLIKHKPTINK
jgi:hypothetical protein